MIAFVLSVLYWLYKDEGLYWSALIFAIWDVISIISCWGAINIIFNFDLTVTLIAVLILIPLFLLIYINSYVKRNKERKE